MAHMHREIEWARLFVQSRMLWVCFKHPMCKLALIMLVYLPFPFIGIFYNKNLSCIFFCKTILPYIDPIEKFKLHEPHMPSKNMYITS